MKNLLGHHKFNIHYFTNLDSHIKRLKARKITIEQQRDQIVNQTLLEWIQKEPEPCFLLPAVLQFIEQIDQEKVIPNYTFSSFEIWLNQFSGLNFEENLRVRGKIAGKWINRSDYQTLFPIGMGKVYEGTHFVTAHKSPDLDTTIASFWGWLDAFAAKVGDGLHIWNLPDGPPSSQIEIDWIFRDILGPSVFTHLPKTRTSLNLMGDDLMKQKGLERRKLTESIAEIQHDQEHNAVVVVDEEGYYLGDWRANDAEGVRQVIILLSSCLRWFENSLHLNLIAFFAKEKLHLNGIEAFLKNLFFSKLKSCEPAREFTSRQYAQVDDFLKLVLKLNEGLDSSFEELAICLCRLAEVPFGNIEGLVKKMKKAKLFDSKGNLIENRHAIFTFLEEAIQNLHRGIVQIRARMEKLDIALKTKHEVFGHRSHTVTIRSDVEEIRSKIDHYSYLTVVQSDKDRLFPIGVIQASDLRKNTLGTVSLRDFCNRDEMGIPSFLEVISVIDHHKTVLNTFAPPMAVLSDVQSSNTLVAQKAFEINDSNSTQELQSIDKQISALNTKKQSPQQVRLLRRLLNQQLIAHKKSSYFVDPQREYLEYLHFLYGIIDDTDLLSKVTAIDVECIASLLNRMKSLSLGKEVEIISFDDIPRDSSFPKKAATRILQNEDMYSLYSKVFQYREKEVEKNLTLCAKDEPCNLFADTKEQNGCCRVGQTKYFASNIRHFEKHADEIRQVWLQKAMKVNKDKPDIDLHIHMISTIVNAEEVYKGTIGKYSHQDELWIWIANKEIAIEHLKRFLNAFQNSPGLKNNPMEVEFLGANADELATLFKESFMDIPQKKTKSNLPIAVLKFKAATLNSRKAMVSPFLPTLG